jgi:phospholipid/cholesterol/gamma-HCH transport system permease protein
MTTREGGADVARWQWSVDAGADGVLVLRLSGRWLMQDHLPRRAAVERELGARLAARGLAFDTRGVGAWDSGLVVFVRQALDAGQRAQLVADLSGLPAGVRKLLDLAAAVPERETGRGARSVSFLARVGTAALRGVGSAREMVTFLGEAGVPSRTTRCQRLPGRRSPSIEMRRPSQSPDSVNVAGRLP